jgi:hypothetical protein
MPTITGSNVAQAIVKLVAADALPALVGNLFMGNKINRVYEPVLGTAGDTVNIPIAPQMVANNIAEGGQVQTQNPSLGNAQIVLNTHAEATFGIPDVTRIIATPDLLQIYMRSAVIAIAERIETDIYNLFPLFTFNTPVGAGNTPITEAVLDSAETSLFSAKVPADMNITFVSTAAAYSALRQIERFSEQRMIDTGTGITAGTMGQLKGMDIMRSQYAPKVSTTTYGLAFGRDAIGMAMRKLPLPMPGTGAVGSYAELGNFGMRAIMSYNPNTLSQQVTVDVFYGVNVLRNQYAIQVLS